MKNKYMLTVVQIVFLLFIVFCALFVSNVTRAYQEPTHDKGASLSPDHSQARLSEKVEHGAPQLRIAEARAAGDPLSFLLSAADVKYVRQPTSQVGALDSPPPYVTAPVDLPGLSIERWPGTLAEGYIFLATYDVWPPPVDGPAYILILDNDGELVYYDDPLGIPLVLDFKKQKNGQLTYFLPFTFFSIDSHYQAAGQYAADGYVTDGHDLQLLDNGNALLLIHDQQTVDLSGVFPGGSKDALVIGCIVQEIDPTGKKVFEWNSWLHLDEIKITDTVVPLENNPLRYIHCNSVEEDYDGNLLVSNRNLSEVTKIDRKSGDIIWRLGGKKNDFTFIGDGGFSYQHDARRLPNGRLTVFDNGNDHLPKHSRGVEYEIDEVGMTATLTAEFRNTPDSFSPAMGSMQTLSNGNVLLGWGTTSTPVLIEFDRQGNKLLELSTVSTEEERFGSYRAFRFPWQGYPIWPASLAVQTAGDTVDLFFSWNGSTETASYKVLAGKDLDDLQMIAEVAKDGFETTYSYDVPEDGVWFFQVAPVTNNGADGVPSNFVPVAVGGVQVHLPVVASD